MMIAISIYLGIGFLIGIVIKKTTESSMNKYDEKMEQLYKMRDEAETFEEKCDIRNTIVEEDKKYMFEKNQQDVEKLYSRQFVMNYLVVGITIGWMPALAYAIVKIVREKS